MMHTIIYVNNNIFIYNFGSSLSMINLQIPNSKLNVMKYNQVY